ncbi:MAG TPA: prolyl oligopeptidase family serine peptidase [Tepidisphaeraceae bacterium]|nr:prolyl oligopeptidase family serine peptidase [Tepidisphaeraceae bacterium]
MRTLLCALCVFAATSSLADDPKARNPQPGPGDKALAAYFAAEVDALAKASLDYVCCEDNWAVDGKRARAELQDMLGLNPWPERTDLKANITGRLDHPEFTVENLHYQSRPGLYVTGNLYVPKGLKAPAPAVLYVCGHGTVKKNNIPYGSKASYQHWGAWLARNGYVCLVLDTLQLGEIEGTHHGLYRENMWWWQGRGYTPAGVEAWNGIRALDYLSTRPEIDKNRLAVTGRSGGGATSWWVAALDERVKVAAPTAGITDLRNHVVDGVIAGHCDCMFMVNSFRWDFGTVMALVAPRALLFENTDKDSIFPLDGVYRTYVNGRTVFEVLRPMPSVVPTPGGEMIRPSTASAAKPGTPVWASDKNLGLLITEGPHKDTQELQVPTLRWLNRFFKGDDSPVKNYAEKLFEPEQLRVFKPGEEPKDQINTKIHDTFVAAAPTPKVPASDSDWTSMRDGWLKQLADKSLRGWPADKDAPSPDPKPLFSETAGGLTVSAYDFTSQHDVKLRLTIVRGAAHAKAGAPPKLLVMNVLDDRAWDAFARNLGPAFPKAVEGALPPLAGDKTAPSAIVDDLPGLAKMLAANDWAMAYVAPRGVGPTEFTRDPRKRTHVLRSFGLIGQTLDGMQAYDVRRAVQTVRALPDFAKSPLWLQAQGRMAGNALYASLYERGITRLDLHDLPATHGASDAPQLLNVLRVMDVPAALAMSVERSRVVLYGDSSGAGYAKQVSKALHWDEKKLELRPKQ